MQCTNPGCSGQMQRDPNDDEGWYECNTCHMRMQFQ